MECIRNPQSEVTGSELTNKIREADYDSNGDATVDGKKYRRINYFQTGIKSVNQRDDFYVENWTGGSTDEYNYYRYFLYEPIRWRILSNDGNTLLLQTAEGIDCQPFASNASQMYSSDTNDMHYFWSKCDLRNWLNYNGGECTLDRYHYRNSLGFYYYAFSNEEKNKIQVTHLTQDSYPSSKNERHGGEDTDDKIFILSYTELEKTEYGFCDSIQCFARTIKNTEYAYAVTGHYLYPNSITGSYWIRTPGSNFIQARVCSVKLGTLHNSSRYDSYVKAVCPAANVSYNLSDCFKVTFSTGTSEAIEPQIMLGSSVAKEPETPTREGYTFSGWYTDKNCTKPYNFTTKLSKDTTLYAGWKAPNSNDVVTQKEIEEAEKITGFKKDNVSYKILSKTEKTVVYNKNNNKKSKIKKVKIPATVQYGGITYKVTEIGENVFKGCKNLTTVTISKNITTIGKNAFKNCSKLKTITVKTTKLTKKNIGKNAFKGIHKNATFKLKISKKKYKTYKKVFKQNRIGYKKTMKIKRI